MKASLYSLCFVVISLTLHGQSYDWVKHFGSPGSDYTLNVEFDQDGNVYATGFYRAGPFVIEGDTLPFIDNMDSYLAKFDPAGNLLWVVPMYGQGVFDRTEALEVDANGDLYLLSTIQDVQSIGDQQMLQVPLGNDIDILLLKFDTDGNLLWSRTYGGPSSDLAYNFLLRDSDIVLVGHYNDTLRFSDDVFLTDTTGSQDMFVAAVDLNGEPLWARHFGAERFDRLYELAEHSNGDLAVCGYSSGNWTFGATDLEQGVSTFDGFVGRLTANGEPLWARQLLSLGNNNGQVWSVTADDEGNTYVTTAMYGQTMVDDTMFDAGESAQQVIIRYDEVGEIDWLQASETNGSMDDATGYAIKYAEGRIWAAGSIGRGMEMFGVTYNGLDTTNLHITVLNTSGTLLTDFYEGGAASSIGFGMDVMDETVICAIAANGDAQFNGQSFPTSSDDPIIARIDFSDVLLDVGDSPSNAGVRLYPNPASEYLFIESPEQHFSTIEMFDAGGRRVLSSKYQSEIAVNHLLPGSYYLKLGGNENSLMLPVVVVH